MQEVYSLLGLEWQAQKDADASKASFLGLKDALRDYEKLTAEFTINTKQDLVKRYPMIKS